VPRLSEVEEEQFRSCGGFFFLFVDALELADLVLSASEGIRKPAATGRPAYHLGSILEALHLRIISNRVQSRRRLEREAGRTFGVIYGLLGRLVDDK